MPSSGLISLIHRIHCPPNQPTVASSPAQKPQPPSNLSLTSFKGAFYLPVVSMCPAPSLPTAWNTNGVAVRWGQECCNSALPLKQVWGRPCFPGSLLLPGAVSLSDGMWNIHGPRKLPLLWTPGNSAAAQCSRKHDHSPWPGHARQHFLAWYQRPPWLGSKLWVSWVYPVKSYVPAQISC